jgi:dTDP-4-dehydrorhamnose reductase
MPQPLYDRILLTGAGGMLAHAFKRSLAHRRLSFLAPTREEADITKPSALEELFSAQRPTLVLNCAAYTKVDLCEEQVDACDSVNGEGVGNLARLCEQHGAALVHFSTDYVFDGSVTRPLRPDDPVGPQSAYGRSKLLGEQLLERNAPPRWLIIRTAWLYGPNGPCFPQTMINAARAGKPLKVVNDQTGSPTFTYDLAEATLDLLDRNASGIWHLTNSGQTTWFDFTRAILDEFNLKTDLSPTTSGEWKKIKPNSATRPAYSVLDVSPYEQLVGKPMPDWRDALHRYRLALESA